MNVKQIATGKRVMGVFEAEHKRLTDDGDQSHPEGLQVFQNPVYANDLRQLLDCSDLNNSFNAAAYSPKYDQVAGALIMAQKIFDQEQEQKKNQSVFVT